MRRRRKILRSRRAMTARPLTSAWAPTIKREMDLVLGRFADAEIASLGSSELDDYELLLEAQDRDVFSWLTGETEIPSLYDTPVLWKIRAFYSHTGPIHT